ncbi:MAG: MogA/MoaB family molybdenum cofactor biosynthesis protein [Pyrinomonadaceae bacterium]
MTANRISAFVVSISDTRSLKDDVSGDELAKMMLSFGSEVVGKLIVSDDLEDIRNTLYVLTEREDVNLILTTGGTGFAPRDNTPEATRAVIDREAPGIAEAMRRETSLKISMAMLSRGIAGIRNRTLIINLPGSPKGVAECFEVIRPILQHAVDQICGQTKH